MDVVLPAKGNEIGLSKLRMTFHAVDCTIDGGRSVSLHTDRCVLGLFEKELELGDRKVRNTNGAAHSCSVQQQDDQKQQ